MRAQSLPRKPLSNVQRLFGQVLFNDIIFLPAFEIEFSDPFLEDTAIQIRGNDQFCLFDSAATNSTSLGLTTLIGSEECNTLVALYSPSKLAIFFMRIEDPQLCVLYFSYM